MILPNLTKACDICSLICSLVVVDSLYSIPLKLVLVFILTCFEKESTPKAIRCVEYPLIHRLDCLRRLSLLTLSLLNNLFLGLELCCGISGVSLALKKEPSS